MTNVPFWAATDETSYLFPFRGSISNFRKEGYGTYFRVPYIDEENEDQTFYVDFIVKLKDDSGPKVRWITKVHQ